MKYTVYVIVRNCGDGSVTIYFTKDEEFYDDIMDFEIDGIDPEDLIETNNDAWEFVSDFLPMGVTELTKENYSDYF